MVARSIVRTSKGTPASERLDGHGACLVETGDGRAGFGAGDFHAEPGPAIRMRRPRWYWHAGNVL